MRSRLNWTVLALAATISASLSATSASAAAVCQTVNGLRWCYNDAACGEACNEVCAATGSTPITANATWFAAQDTPEECAAIASAFGIVGIEMGFFTHACLEDGGSSFPIPIHSAPGGLIAPLLCSTDPGCPNDHRTFMDQLGIPCEQPSRRSICPCNTCGDGIVDVGEQCDDGNAIDGDCCSSTCQYAPGGSPCPDGNLCNGEETCNSAGTCQTGTPLSCDDGNRCTIDSCDPISGCINDNSPKTWCVSPDSSTILMKNYSNDASDKLRWKWSKGGGMAALPPGWGPPLTLCIYGGPSETYLGKASAQDGVPWWKSISAGSRYYDWTLTPDGIKRASVLSKRNLRNQVIVSGQGANLPDLLEGGPAALPLRVQMMSSGISCVESTFGTAAKNDGTVFTARTP